MKPLFFTIAIFCILYICVSDKLFTSVAKDCYTYDIEVACEELVRVLIFDDKFSNRK